jgi:hypothetical protein
VLHDDQDTELDLLVNLPPSRARPVPLGGPRSVGNGRRAAARRDRTHPSARRDRTHLATVELVLPHLGSAVVDRVRVADAGGYLPLHLAVIKSTPSLPLVRLLVERWLGFARGERRGGRGACLSFSPPRNETAPLACEDETPTWSYVKGSVINNEGRASVR